MGFKPFMARAWLGLLLSCLFMAIVYGQAWATSEPLDTLYLCGMYLFSNLFTWFGYHVLATDDDIRWNSDGYARYAVPDSIAGWLIIALFAPAFIVYFSVPVFFRPLGRGMVWFMRALWKWIKALCRGLVWVLAGWRILPKETTGVRVDASPSPEEQDPDVIQLRGVILDLCDQIAKAPRRQRLGLLSKLRKLERRMQALMEGRKQERLSREAQETAERIDHATDLVDGMREVDRLTAPHDTKRK
ncbi:MAG: hypothetical protein WCV84_04245 [Patescibacteria group bacterium]